MNLSECAKESGVVAALATGSMPDELAAHLDSCPVCQDAKVVWSYLQSCADTEPQLPCAETVWWRAQLAKKRIAARRSIAWIDTMQKIAAAIATIVAVAIGAWQSPKLLDVPPMLLAGSAAVLLLLIASVVVVLTLDRGRALSRGM